MKQTEISRIMDEYTDGDLFFDGERDIDTEAVKSRVLDKIQAETRNDIQTAKPKGLKKPLKIFIAAAAAVCCLSAAALAVSLPARFFGTIVTKSEVELTINESGRVTHIYEGQGNPPFEYRNGRIIFTAAEEEKDITDLIDDETPYIYSYISVDTGLESYIAVGGDPGHTGYLEIINIGTAEEPYWTGHDYYAFTVEFKVYGVDLEFLDLSQEKMLELEDSDLTHIKDGYTFEEWEERFVKHHLGGFKAMPWVLRMVEELDLYEAKERMFPEHDRMDVEEFATWLTSGGALYSGVHLPEGFGSDTLEVFEKWHGVDTSAAYDSPAEVRDGRLWVKINGTEKDITDLIDENTPYIEAIEGASCEAWLIVGGTPENYGCTELFNIANKADPDHGITSFEAIDRSNNVIAIGDNPNGYFFTVDGEEISYEQLVEYLKQGVDLNGRFDCVDTTPEWFRAACRELMIDEHVRYVEK